MLYESVVGSREKLVGRDAVEDLNYLAKVARQCAAEVVGTE